MSFPKQTQQQGQTQQNAYQQQGQIQQPMQMQQNMYQQQGQPQQQHMYQQQGQPQQQNPYQQQIQGFPQMQQQQMPFNSVQGYNTNINFPMQQQQQQMPYPVQGFPPVNRKAGTGFRLVKFNTTPPNTTKKDNDKEEETKLKLAAVIVTICDGSTYDSLFSSVKQDAGHGSRVAVYSCSKDDIKHLISNLTSLDQDKIKERTDDLHLLLKDLTEIEDPTCVAINYECCSGCSDNGFSNITNGDSNQIINELQFLLRQKYLVMYSDFSLKALIKVWGDVGDKSALGPNPFVRTGTVNTSVTLNFNPYTLKTCISSQLQSVGELCPDEDHCTVHCMSSTVKYSVKKQLMNKKDGELPYKIQVLTVAKCGKHGNSLSIEVPDFSNIKKGTADKDIEATKLPMKTLFGDAGHVVLDYSGQRDGSNEEGKENDILSGKILVSMTHWCELVKLGDNVSDDVLFKVAAKNLGTGSKAYQDMQTTYASLGGKNASGMQKMQQQQWISQQANMMVQQQAPCNNMMNSNIGYFSKGKGNY